MQHVSPSYLVWREKGRMSKEDNIGIHLPSISTCFKLKASWTTLVKPFGSTGSLNRQDTEEYLCSSIKVEFMKMTGYRLDVLRNRWHQLLKRALLLQITLLHQQSLSIDHKNIPSAWSCFISEVGLTGTSLPVLLLNKDACSHPACCFWNTEIQKDFGNGCSNRNHSTSNNNDEMFSFASIRSSNIQMRPREVVAPRRQASSLFQSGPPGTPSITESLKRDHREFKKLYDRYK